MVDKYDRQAIASLAREYGVKFAISGVSGMFNVSRMAAKTIVEQCVESVQPSQELIRTFQFMVIPFG